MGGSTIPPYILNYKQMKPRYLVRSVEGDLSMFSLNKDGITYSSMHMKESLPDVKANIWSLSTLLERGFKECGKKKAKRFLKEEMKHYLIIK